VADGTGQLGTADSEVDWEPVREALRDMSAEEIRDWAIGDINTLDPTTPDIRDGLPSDGSGPGSNDATDGFTRFGDAGPVGHTEWIGLRSRP
jgi:hypothetical protein